MGGKFAITIENIKKMFVVIYPFSPNALVFMQKLNKVAHMFFTLFLDENKILFRAFKLMYLQSSLGYLQGDGLARLDVGEMILVKAKALLLKD